MLCLGPLLMNQKITIDLYEILYLKMHPYQLSVEPLIDFEQASNGVNPEVVGAVTLQDGVCDAAVDLAVQVFSQNLGKHKR